MLSDYASQIAATDVLNQSDLNPVLHGLFGEVGGIMAAAKKHVRERSAFPGFKKAAEEEFGDTLWYLAAICRRLDFSLEEIFGEAARLSDSNRAHAVDVRNESETAYLAETASLDSTLVRLGQSAAALLGRDPARAGLVAFARAYMDAIGAAELEFSEVVHSNIRKARGAFLEPRAEDMCDLDFDSEFGIEERLPMEFKIRVNQRGSGRSYLQWNGVFIGDPLTDNIADQDGYRFHDVFHLANAAILHWSPVMRALIRHKRKSNPRFDEEQDSGRAIVVEEGIAAWVFARAKELNYFKGQERVPLGILKTIGEFVSGYEVERCPLKLWEKSILEGFAVFRQLKVNQGGWVIGSREQRTINYMSLESEK